MTTRFLSAVFTAAFLLLLSLTTGKADAKANTQANHCQNKSCCCVSSDGEIHCIP